MQITLKKTLLVALPLAGMLFVQAPVASADDDNWRRGRHGRRLHFQRQTSGRISAPATTNKQNGDGQRRDQLPTKQTRCEKTTSSRTRSLTREQRRNNKLFPAQHVGRVR